MTLQIDLDKYHSATRYLFTIARALVSWRSILQFTVALFIMEAEYLAVMGVQGGNFAFTF